MDRPVDGSMLAGAGLFAGLDAAACNDVAAAAAHRVQLRAGEAMFEQEDAAEAFYVLITGRVAQATVEGHLVVIRYIGAGEVFGAVPLFTGTGYPASAPLPSWPAWAARRDQSATRRLLDRHPRIVMNALKLSASGCKSLQNRYRELATERVEQRVARAVLRLGKVGRSDDAAVHISVSPVASGYRRDTGTTLHTVSRILSAWEQRGVDDGGECGLSSAIRRHCAHHRRRSTAPRPCCMKNSASFELAQ